MHCQEASEPLAAVVLPLLGGVLVTQKLFLVGNWARSESPFDMVVKKGTFPSRAS